MREGWWTIGLALMAVVVLGPDEAHAENAQPASSPERDLSYFARFDPKGRTSLDYGLWTRFLTSAVLDVGFPDRRRVSGTPVQSGTRLWVGHRGPYRFEANRVVFSLLPKDVLETVSEYRADLERTANEDLQFHRLNRDEQLAFWLNLHNVAIIERISEIYPVAELRRRRESLYEEPVVTIAGVPLSLNDIRLRIVYRHWNDPKVMYGFFLGVIGGPSIRDTAFDSTNLNALLNEAATEFVNSLRGVDRRGKKLHVSELYAEARAAFFPNWPDDLYAHLRAYANEEVKPLLNADLRLKADSYDWSIADLIRGTREVSRTPIVTTEPDFSGLPEHGRIFVERVFRRKLRLPKLPEGRVTIRDEEISSDRDGDASQPEDPDNED